MSKTENKIPNNSRLVLLKQSDDYQNQMKQSENLKELFVIENTNLDKLSLKNKCTRNLEKLIAYSNKLSKVPNLSKCIYLQVIWLADNNIRSIQGLDHLQYLRELNLSKNNISNVDPGLEKNISLITLNLSANPIRHVESIVNLFEVKTLKKFYLADPLYGDCPITKCQMHYRLQILHRMPFLQELDTFSVTMNDKELERQFLHSYLLEYENEFQTVDSKFKSKQQSILKKFHEDMQIFHFLQNKYKGDLTKSTSKLLESQQKVLLHEIKNWYSRFKNTMKEINQRRILGKTQCIINKESFGNKQFHLSKDTEVLKLFQDVLESFVCNINSEKVLFENIQITSVTFLKRQIHEGIYEHYEKLKHLNFYLLQSPFKTSSLMEWQHISANNFPSMKIQNILLTNCLATCDSEYLKIIRKIKQDFLENFIGEPRVAIVVGVTKDNDHLEEYQITDHMGGGGDVHSCLEFHANNSGCVYYAVEYQYELKEKYKLLRDASYLKTELKPLSSQSGKSLSHHLSYMRHHLTSVTLSGCNISDVGNVKDVYANVKDLDVSYNQLTSISQIFIIFPNLNLLNFSHNSIAQLRSQKLIDSLETLDISWNRISSAFELLRILKTFMKNLKCLNIEFNPFEDMMNEEFLTDLFVNTFDDPKMFNQINLIHKRIYKTMNIYDEINEDEIVLNVDSSSLKDQLHITTMGLCNKLVNGRTPHDLLFIRNGNCLEGVCAKSSTSFDTVSMKSTSVKWISVTNNLVSNVSIVQSLINLQELYLSHNRIQEINFDFNFIPNLTKLDLSYNFLDSLKSLKKVDLKCLLYLNLSGNLIEKIKDIEHLHSIEQLYLAWNKIREDLTVLREIKTFIRLKCLDITGNPLNRIHNIKYFIAHSFPIIKFINGEQITEQDKKQAIQISNRTLDYAYLLRIHPRSELTNLTQLTLSNVSLKVLQLNKNIVPNMESVNLERNNIEYMFGLCDLPNLKTLRLSQNKMKGLHEDINFAFKNKIFPKMETLYLNLNGITSLANFHFEMYENLRFLFLQSNKISELNGLENILKLRVLVLDKNEITHIPVNFFERHKNIDQLYLESNKLQDLQFVSNFGSSPQKIFLGHNRIRDFNALQYLKPLKRLKEITLLGNYISWKADYYQNVIQILEQVQYLDGHNIQYTSL